MSNQQLLEEIEEYHPPKKEDVGSNIVPGKYTIHRVYFDSVEDYGEVVNIEADEGKFYTFSKVLRKQLTNILRTHKHTEDGRLGPIRVEVMQVKTYLTLV